MTDVFDLLDCAYIGGAWVQVAGDERLPVIDPAREETIAHVTAGTAGDLDRAVAAAARPFPPLRAVRWPSGSPCSSASIP
jgi:acyl-CoA reductase-like NAD-dependent aldehyde dehydrogenase